MRRKLFKTGSGLLLIAIVFCSSCQGAITFYDTGGGWNIRIRNQDYTNVTEAIYEYDQTQSVNLTDRLSVYQYMYFNSTWNIGQTTKAVNVTLKNKHIYFNISDEDYFSQTTLITVQGVRSNLTIDNCIITLNDTTNNINVFINSPGYVTIVNSTLNSIHGNPYINAKKLFARNTILRGVWIAGQTINLKDVYILNVTSTYALFNVNIEYAKNVYIKNCKYAIVASTVKCNVTNFYFENNQYLIYFLGNTQPLNFIDCEIDKIIAVLGVGSVYYTNISYSFKVRVIDASGDVANANVRLWNRSMSLRYNGMTPLNGTVSTLLPLGKFRGSTTFDYECPYTINISKGERFMNFSFNNSAKINWTTYLHDIPCPGEILDISNPNPENNSVVYANPLGENTDVLMNCTLKLGRNVSCTDTQEITAVDKQMYRGLSKLNDTYVVCVTGENFMGERILATLVKIENETELTIMDQQNISHGTIANFVNIERLNETYFVVDWLNDTIGGSRTECAAGYVSGGELHFGEVYVFSSSNCYDSYRSLSRISNTSFIIVYLNETNYVFGKVGTVSGTEIIFSSPCKLANEVIEPSEPLSVEMINDTRFLLAYTNFSGIIETERLKIVVCSREGVVLSNGTPTVLFNSVYHADFISRLVGEKPYFVAACTDYLQLGKITGMSVQLGAVEHFASNSFNPGVEVLSDRRLLLSYRNNTGTTFGASKTAGFEEVNVSFVAEEFRIEYSNYATYHFYNQRLDNVTAIITYGTLEEGLVSNSSLAVLRILPFVRLNFSENSSGTPSMYARVYAVENGTYGGLSTNFSEPGQTYWWNVSATVQSIWENDSYRFFTSSVDIDIKNPKPANGSDKVSFSRLNGVETTCYIGSNAFCPGDGGCTSFSVEFSSNATGSWQTYYSGVIYAAGYCGSWNPNFNKPGRTYWWRVRVNDTNSSVSETETYHFTTVTQPYGSVRVFGTEYAGGEPGTVYAQVLYNDGLPSNVSSVTVTIWERTKKLVNKAPMQYMAGSYGCYHYNFTVPWNVSVFLVEVVSSDPQAYGSGEFHVSRWSSAVMDMNNTLGSINGTVSSIYLLLSYINTTYLPAIEAKVDALNAICAMMSSNVSVMYANWSYLYGYVREIYNMTLYLNNTIWGGHVSSEIIEVLEFINDTRWGFFNASDIYTIADGIEDVVLYINSTTVSAAARFEVRLTDFGEINPGDDYLAQITVFDSDGTMMDADIVPRITLYDSAGNTVINDAAMMWISTGQYGYSYTTAGGQPSGQWTTVVRTIVRGNTVRNVEYWELESNPPEVTVAVVDRCIPIIEGKISITNEGTGDQEYCYYWWVTPRSDGDYVDADTVDSGSASKLVHPLEKFETTKTLVVSTVGVYWFKVRVYYGTEWSAAVARFEAAMCGGVGGGGIAAKRAKLRIVVLDQKGEQLRGVSVAVYDDGRLIGTEITNETGVVLFSIPVGLTIRLVAIKEGYEDVEMTLSLVSDRMETIRMRQTRAESMMGMAIFLVLFVIIIVSLYYLLRSRMKHPERKML